MKFVRTVKLKPNITLNASKELRCLFKSLHLIKEQKIIL